MLAYIARRILYAIPIALGVSIVCFSLVYLAPGDPLQTILPADATAETVALIKHEYGFDRPIPVQFAYWLWRVLHGRFRRVDLDAAAGRARGDGLAAATPRCWRCSRCRSLSASATRWASSPAGSPAVRSTAS